jgi:hypothetical protein
MKKDVHMMQSVINSDVGKVNKWLLKKQNNNKHNTNKLTAKKSKN